MVEDRVDQQPKEGVMVEGRADQQPKEGVMVEDRVKLWEYNRQPK